MAKTKKLKVKKPKGLKVKKVKARIKLLKAMPYKKVMIYIRRIDEEIFEFVIPFKGEIWSSYLIIKPEGGKRKLTKDEVNQSAALIFSSAVTTVDFILGDAKVDKKTKEVVKVFEGQRKKLPN
jgi:hypothetical protein